MLIFAQSSIYKTVLVINFTVQNVYHDSQVEFIQYVENTTLEQILIWLSNVYNYSINNNMVYSVAIGIMVSNVLSLAMDTVLHIEP